jgi:hypothetical protein
MITAFALATSFLASASPSPRGSARRAFIWRRSSSLFRLAGDEMNEFHPIGSLGEKLVVLEEFVPVGQFAIGAHPEAEE